MHKALLFFLLLAVFWACQLVGPVAADGGDRVCCDHDLDGDDDDNDGLESVHDMWYLYIPTNINIECHREILTQDENDTPDLTGYAFESNGCHRDKSTCTTVAGNRAGSADWCFQTEDDDDDGHGVNAFLSTFLTQTRDASCGNSYTVTRTWGSQTNCAGVQLESTQTINVIDTTPPELNVPRDITVECESAINIISQSNDERFGAATVTDLCTQPSVISENAVSTGPGCVETITRTFSTTDGCFTSTDTQVVTIVDTTPPVIEHPTTLVVACDNTNIAQFITAADACQSTLSNAVQSAETLYPGACTGEYTIERVFTADDGCGNIATHTQLLIVEDNDPPVLSISTEGIVSLNFCEENVDPPVPFTATDACGGPVYTEYSDSAEVGGDEETGIFSIVRTYTTTDDCGNSVTFEQIIEVVDYETIRFDVDQQVFASRYNPFNVFFSVGSYDCPTEAELIISYSPLTLDFTSAAGGACAPAGEGVAVCDLNSLVGFNNFVFELDEYLPDLRTTTIDFQLEINIFIYGYIAPAFIGNQRTTVIFN